MGLADNLLDEVRVLGKVADDRHAEIQRLTSERDDMAAAADDADFARREAEAELATVRAELERLRPIVAAARAFVTFPQRPESTDPNEAHSWDLEAEGRYQALAELINTTTEGAPTA